MKIRGSVVSFTFPHPPEDEKKKKKSEINSTVPLVSWLYPLVLVWFDFYGHENA